MISPVALTLAFLLDLAIGDPRWMPHPVTLIGKGITGAEHFLRAHLDAGKEKAAGVLLVLLIVIPTGVVTFAITKFLFSFSNRYLLLLGAAIFIYLASTTLALRGLIGSARLVIRSVKAGDMSRARRDLSMIVGRDTDTLGEEAVLRATIETVAENVSDGFVAPLFYLSLGGLPLAMAYKAVNTLDSMVGYKNDRYVRFGWAAARLDDFANYIPARIAGAFISVAAFFYYLAKPGERRLSRAGAVAKRAFVIMLRDGRKHTSPNSGVPEAAMAGALGVRLGGPATYGGAVVVKPFIGEATGQDHLGAADASLAVAATASALTLACAVACLALGRVL